MTTLSVDAVGLCAHFSTQGDWAFDYAFALAKRRDVPLNVFHFLADPFDPTDRTGHDLEPQERSQLIIDRERELRFRYEDKLGDFLVAGFRLCEENEWVELHRCLTKREFQVLVLPWPHRGCTFGRRPFEDFVEAFVCPIVAVGPDSPYTLSLNHPAVQILDQLDLTPTGGWRTIDEAVGEGAASCRVATPHLRA